MYLVDTNIWLERLLSQERAEEVGRFLNAIPSEQLYITDFTFHSIALALTRLEESETLLQFVQDVFIDGDVILLRLEPEILAQVIELMGEFSLDFDDAYQYGAAEQFNLTLISFDTDFDRTTRGKVTPAELL